MSTFYLTMLVLVTGNEKNSNIVLKIMGCANVLRRIICLIPNTNSKCVSVFSNYYITWKLCREYTLITEIVPTFLAESVCIYY